ncbi:MAG TPA: hypothetical protein PKL97_05730 [Candidatus Omnitrophota bacterium]|nr:hypothetical protein [Candidatus Omnitrophota bacterium]
MTELLLVFAVGALGGNLVFSGGLGLRYFLPSERTPGAVFAQACLLGTLIALAALFSAGLDIYAPAQWKAAYYRTAVLLCGSFLIYKAGGHFSPLRRFDAGPALLFAAALVTGTGEMPFPEKVFYGIGTGAGAAIAWILSAGLAERLDFNRAPKPLKSAPIFFIAVGLLTLAFHYFAGLSKMCF